MTENYGDERKWPLYNSDPVSSAVSADNFVTGWCLVRAEIVSMSVRNNATFFP